MGFVKRRQPFNRIRSVFFQTIRRIVWKCACDFLLRFLLSWGVENIAPQFNLYNQKCNERSIFMPRKELEKMYNPREFEDRIYQK